VSVLVAGLSHKSAPVTVLERAAISGDALAKLLSDLARAEPVAETFVVSTCNRVEVYADVDRFHAGVTAICELLARHCGIPAWELTPYLYVHYEDRAVSHLLAVACGLDSMVAGDEQIVGQVRSALRLAGEQGAAGRVLGDLGRVALRAGKRARAETGIGRAGVSLLSLAVQLAAPGLGGSAGSLRGSRAEGLDRRHVSVRDNFQIRHACWSALGSGAGLLACRLRRPGAAADEDGGAQGQDGADQEADGRGHDRDRFRDLSRALPHAIRPGG
jgi:hypothetical protein